MSESQVPNSSQSGFVKGEYLGVPDSDAESLGVKAANTQAKAALPQPKITPPWEEEPRLPSDHPVAKAYEAAKSWLSDHEEAASKYLDMPAFRKGLDKMAEDIDTSPYVKAASPTAQGVVSGVTGLMRSVPVGKDLKETALMAATNLPELPEGHIFKDIEGVRPASAKEIIESQGLVYKGEIVPTSKVHMFEHPDHPGKTASLFEHEINPDSVKSKMDSKIKDFESGAKEKAVLASKDAAHIDLNQKAPEDVAAILNKNFQRVTGQKIPAKILNQSTPGDLLNAFGKLGLDEHIAKEANAELHAAGYRKLGDLHITLDGMKTADELGRAKSVTKNASGESAASQEAINRAASEKSKGESYARIDSRSKKETPMSSIDGADAKPGPYDVIVKRGSTGGTIRDSGTKAQSVSQDVLDGKKSETAKPAPAKPSAKSVEMTKEVSRAAEDYLASLGKSKK